MKNSYPLFEKISEFILRNLFLLFVAYIILSIGGFYHLKRGYDKEIRANLESTTKVIESMWQSVTLAHEETMRVFFEFYVMDPKTIEILRKANSPKEEEQNQARMKLFRHLGEAYEKLKSDYMIRQLHFHTPDNRSFLRFHAPFLYGDDLTPHRPTVVLANQLKKPQIAFETGRLISGYRYVYPILDTNGVHLGSVELSRSFEAIRRTLAQVTPAVGYVLLLKASDVMPKILEPYRKYYQEIAELEGWVIEDPHRELPDTVKPLPEEYEKVLKETLKDQAVKRIVNSPHDETIYVKVSNKYYKITVIKLYEPKKDRHSALVVALSTGDDIDLILKSQQRTTVIYFSLILLIAISMFIFFKQMALITKKHRELEAITAVMGSGLFLINNKGEVTFVNDSALDLLHYSKEELLGKIVHQVIHEHTGPTERCPLHRAITQGRPYSADDTFRRKDGSLLDVHVICRPLRYDKEFTGSVLVFYDITERKKAEKELLMASITDPLTGLYNRRYFHEELLQSKNLADRYKIPFSIIMIDIDNFKVINDTFGHDVGDVVLKTLAKVLRLETRSADLVARWGGEEFLILLPNTGIEGAQKIAERLRRTIELLRVKDIPPFTISLGVASYRSPENIEDLLQRADRALYEAKASGKNCVIIER